MGTINLAELCYRWWKHKTEQKRFTLWPNPTFKFKKSKNSKNSKNHKGQIIKKFKKSQKFKNSYFDQDFKEN